MRGARPARAAFLDSCGLARLLAARRRARRLGTPAALGTGPKAIQRLFALSAVDEAFEMVNEVPAALALAPRLAVTAPSDLRPA